MLRFFSTHKFLDEMTRFLDWTPTTYTSTTPTTRGPVSSDHFRIQRVLSSRSALEIY